MVRLLTNPLMLRAGLVFFAAACALVIAIWLIRSVRRSLTSEANLDSAATTKLESLPFHLYNSVIQQLKQQKHELQVQNQAEQRRARTTENFSQAVLSNLSSGVLVFGPNGLVRQTNPAAKQILGFNSPSGMNAEEIFRNALVCASNAGSSPTPLADEVTTVLREDQRPRQVEAEYTTPTGQKVRLAVTISPVPAVDGGLLGAACLISDRSEFERIRHEEELRSEVSAEMALELRTSLATISGYVQQLAKNRDPELARQLAADIAGEAARLDRHIGGFLAAKRKAASMSSGTAKSATTVGGS